MIFNLGKGNRRDESFIINVDKIVI
jgi:hypothetical protein